MKDIKVIYIIFATLIVAIGPSLASAQFQNPQATLEELFSKLVPSADQSNSQAQVSFSRHFVDSNLNLPTLEWLKSQPPIPGSFSVNGKLTYLNMVQKEYRYDVFQLPFGLLIEVRLFFRKASKKDKVMIDRWMKVAMNYWNNNRDRSLLSQDYLFSFVRAEKAADAHYVIDLNKGDSALYDTVWGRNGGDKMGAHEIGHMLGLNDEYDLISVDAFGRCQLMSIMCAPHMYGSVPKKFHYYHVLRRIFSSPSNKNQ